MTGNRWWQVEALTGADRQELVVDRLLQSGAAGVEERTEDDRVRLLTGFPDEHRAQQAASALHDLVDAVHVRPILDDGLDAWREHARPVVTRAFVISPAWTAPVHDPDRIVIELDPGRTFGSGSHPSTRLCLDLLADGDPSGDDALDVGTGSGVLAIAAVLLGAPRAIAIDIDPSSPPTVAANAARNAVHDRIEASTASVEQVASEHGRFGVVLANLLAPTLHSLAPALTSAVAAGGRLIVAGLLDDQAGEIGDRLETHGLRPVRTRAEAGWTALALEHAGPRR